MHCLHIMVCVCLGWPLFPLRHILHGLDSTTQSSISSICHGDLFVPGAGYDSEWMEITPYHMQMYLKIVSFWKYLLTPNP